MSLRQIRNNVKLLYIRDVHRHLWTWLEAQCRQDQDTVSRRVAWMISMYKKAKDSQTAQAQAAGLSDHTITALTTRNTDFRDPDLVQKE